MALYHLDPRQAGTGAAPDIMVRDRSRFDTGWRPTQPRFGVYTMPPGDRIRLAVGEDEQSALRAAREAAGFGHVAEKPCDAINYEYLAGDKECSTCHWRWDTHRNHRDAHKEGKD